MTSSGVSKIVNTMALAKGSKAENAGEKSNDFDLLLQKTAADGELLKQPGPGAEQFASQQALFPKPGETADSRQSFQRETGGMTWDRVPRAEKSQAGQSLTTETKNAYGQWQEKVKKLLTEKLDVSEEELDEAMARLGITFENLLTGEGLQELCMELTGAADITDLLFDGGFQELMQEAGMLLEQLTEQVDLSPEELKMLIQKAMEESQNPGMDAEVPEPDSGMEAVPSGPVDETIAEEPVKEEAVLTPEQQIADAKEQQKVPKAPEQQTTAETANQRQNPVQTPDRQNVEASAEGREASEEAVEEPREMPGSGTQNQQEAEFSQTGEEGSKDNGLNSQWKERSASSQQVSRPEPDSQQVSFHTTVQNTVGSNGEAVVQTVQRTFVDVQNILQQISEFTRVTVTQDVSRLEMQLNPEHLGKLFMQLSSKEGVITAQLVAQNEAVKNALESQMSVLKENMNNQGMKVEAVEVTVASHEFEEQFQGEQQAGRQQEEGSHRQRRFLNVDQLEELAGQLSEEDSLAARIMVENGNSMDMTA